MKKVFFVSLLLLSMVSCNSDKMKQSSEIKSLKYLALGDSYTIGEGVTEKERYPVLLQDSLMASGIDLPDVQIVARTGWTTDELAEAMDSVRFHPPYDLVTLLIGVNNQYRGYTPESYRPEFLTLLKRAVDYAGGDNKRVIVLSIPDWGVTPFADGRDREQIAQEIDAYNAINRKESEEAGVTWVDVTAISREAATMQELLTSDGLHPSGLMYQYWVDEVFPLALKKLKGE